MRIEDISTFNVPFECVIAIIDDHSYFQATTGETLILKKLVNGKKYVMWEIVSPTNTKARATIEIVKESKNKTLLVCVDGSGLLASIGLP